MKISVFIIVFCIALVFIALPVYAENITISYPANVSAGIVFTANLTLVNFTDAIYDIKIDIMNSTTRLGKIYDSSSNSWKSTIYYIIGVVNTSYSNNSLFYLNITESYNGTATINITIRNSISSDLSKFGGHIINITPLFINTSSCIQNWTCTSFGSCSSSGTQTRTCTDANTCGNNTGKPAESQSCTYGSSNSSTQNATITLSMNWNEDEIINGEEFTITMDAHSLAGGYYDLKLWIEFDENTTVISERYDNNNSEWKSGTYYVNQFFSGSGDTSKNIKLRINSDYSNYGGDARIGARLRKNGNVLYETSKYIEILKSNTTASSNSSNSDTASQANIQQSNNQTEANSSNSTSAREVILLGTPLKAEEIKKQDSIIYKSKNESIREYTPYFFGAICIFLIFLLLIEKGRAIRKEENEESEEKNSENKSINEIKWKKNKKLKQ